MACDRLRCSARSRRQNQRAVERDAAPGWHPYRSAHPSKQPSHGRVGWGGEVWYYRDNPAQEPPPRAMAAVQLVIKYQLPVSFSSKSDFSDTVDPSTGVSRPRQAKR